MPASNTASNFKPTLPPLDLPDLSFRQDALSRLPSLRRRAAGGTLAAEVHLIPTNS